MKIPFPWKWSVDYKINYIYIFQYVCKYRDKKILSVRFTIYVVINQYNIMISEYDDNKLMKWNSFLQGYFPHLDLLMSSVRRKEILVMGGIYIYIYIYIYII